MHLLSVTLNLIRRFTKRQVPRGGVYGRLVIFAHPRLMVHEGTRYIKTPPEVSDPSSSESSELIFVVFENIHGLPKIRHLSLISLSSWHTKVQTLVRTIPQNYCKLLLYLNSNLNYLLKVRHTISATCQLSKQDKNKLKRVLKVTT